MRPHDPRARRMLVCAFAAAGHVVLVLALLRLEEADEPRDQDLVAVAQLLPDLTDRVPRPVMADPAPGAREAIAPAAAGESAASAAARAPTSRLPDRAAAPAGGPSSSLPKPGMGSRGPVDWYAEAAIVVREAAKRATTPPVDPFSHRYPKRPGRPPPSVFRPEVVNRGKVVTNADGERIVWINENCYVSLGSDSIALRDVHAAHRNVTFCRIPLGKRNARGDLFERMPNHGPVDLDAPLEPW